MNPRPVAALLWISSAQFFLAQAIVQSAWSTPFSLTHNFISDLGNTACAPYPAGSDNYVCSPWHLWMNASFVLFGVTIPLGAGFARHAFRPGARAGRGYIAVGLFPENVNMTPHKIGAGLVFVCGNLGLALLGITVPESYGRKVLGMFLAVLGIVGLVATALFVSGRYLGAGIGGMERFAAYPLPVGLIVLGGFLVRNAPIPATHSHEPRRVG